MDAYNVSFWMQENEGKKIEWSIPNTGWYWTWRASETPSTDVWWRRVWQHFAPQAQCRMDAEWEAIFSDSTLSSARHAFQKVSLWQVAFFKINSWRFERDALLGGGELFTLRKWEEKKSTWSTTVATSLAWHNLKKIQHACCVSVDHADMEFHRFLTTYRQNMDNCACINKNGEENTLCFGERTKDKHR